MDFHSHFSDSSGQNEATTFEHMIKFIHWMYEHNLFIKCGIIFVTKDVCSKQCICENEIWLLSVLGFTYRVMVDICFN